MNIGLYQSAASMSALEQWQNAVAQNISSGQVTGYRERTVQFSVQQAGEYVLDKSGQPGSDANQQASFPSASNAVNFTAGKSEPTGNPLDLSIQGSGFFQVQMTNGTTAYTRNGEFKTRNDGTLVTTANMPVLSESGTNIVLQQQGANVTINPEGVISEGAQQVGRIGVVQFANSESLTPISGGIFVAPQNTTPEPVQKPGILQGYLEASNVSPLHEMVDMVQISRAYEANQKIITNADQQMQKTMDALG